AEPRPAWRSVGKKAILSSIWIAPAAVISMSATVKTLLALYWPCPMKTLFLAGLLAFLAALLIAGLFKPKPLEAQLMHLQLEQSVPDAANELAAESAEIQALFLAYADDPVLLAKARLALLRYPELTRPVFLSFGASQAFQDVLKRYGEDVVLPIHYFLTHEVATLEFMRGLSDTAKATRD